MAFQPAGSLNNRTFIGLIIAQFLAGFNDQAIHASAMFFALHQGILTEAQAISLMPILFYAPWAIFCTLAGHFADRYSKTIALRTWKVSEILISLIALFGFYLGSVQGDKSGGWMVLSTVFLMGTHAAFFAPAKYGAMPEILQPHILSRGNGILESTTFLAAILGTVSGGFLSFLFRNQEVWIGVILLGLSVIGALASFMIASLPAASPHRPFPVNLFKPLVDNLKVLFASKPLALAVLGIAFFIFMVSYMRATMYMHGQTRNPPWNEFHTSLVVATVALGVGLGSPLAGYLSGGKIELGLVPLGCLGMFAATILSAFEIDQESVLVVALIIMGFFSGFYMVPLYTLLQHRKQSKGELVATSNFINVTGAIAASVLFGVLVQICIWTNITPVIPQTDRLAVGTLVELEKDKHGHISRITIQTEDGSLKKFRARVEDAAQEYSESFWQAVVSGGDMPIEMPDSGLLGMFGPVLAIGDQVIVSGYELRGTQRFFLRSATEASPRAQHDNEGLPRFLFFGAALMTLGILLLLWRKLPDFFVRTLFWLRSLGKFKIKAVGMQHLPTNGPVLLATNCDTLESSMQLVSVTDRATTVVLVGGQDMEEGSLLRSMAQRTNLVLVNGQAGAEALKSAEARARAALAQGDMLAIGVNGQENSGPLESLLRELRRTNPAPVVPVFCGSLDEGASVPRVRVVFGEAFAMEVTLEGLRKEIDRLAQWIREHDDIAGVTDSH